jgi:predicted ATP-binding protein involved in virulence
MPEQHEAVYIKEVGIEDFRCFKGKHNFSFADENGEWCRWTVFLGDNNTGKTNLLKAIAGLEPVCVGDSLFYAPGLPEAMNTPVKFVGLKISTNRNNEYDLSYSTLSTSSTPVPYQSENTHLNYLKIYGYGVVRVIERKGISDTENKPNADNLFNNYSKYINFEEWLFQLDYTANNQNTSRNNRKKACKLRDLLKSVLTSDVFPEIGDIFYNSDTNLKNFLSFKTKDGWHRLSELGYGYQATLFWIAEFCKKLFERYPDSKNPLKEPAVLLVDEIDLYLHPQWQRTIIKYLSGIFTQTQFIVTTHSPFIIQSMEKVNLYTLRREEEHIHVEHLGCRSYIGWHIEEVLSEVMGLEDNILTDTYQRLMKQFEEAMNTGNYEQGKEAYDKLMKILHPQSVERELLDIQFSQLIPDDKARIISKAGKADR